MLPSDGFWQSAMFGALIGGIITVVLLKMWEKKRTALGNPDTGNKRPTEHDERF